MSIKGKAYIAGAFEHPTRMAKDKTVAQLHAESALGALRDAGLTKADVDGYFCAGDAPGLGPLAMADYMNLTLRHLDSTDVGGCSYIAHVAPCGGGDRRRQVRGRADHPGRPAAVARAIPAPCRGVRGADAPDTQWEFPYRRRHGECLCHVRGAAHVRVRHHPEQLAWIKVAASHHAQHNPHAMLRDVVTVEQVVNSPD